MYLKTNYAKHILNNSTQITLFITFATRDHLGQIEKI